MTEPLNTPEGFKRVAWAEVSAGTKVYLAGTHQEQPTAYGPHQVENPAARTLKNSRGQVFTHYPEHLLQSVTD